ncbi:TolC family protein [candidate division WOR-3 bacterium]|nr:TolC family protein [candidate division WOR-3 bacterium]
MTLDDVIEIALAKSPELLAAKYEAEAAAKGHEAARGRNWPFAEIFGDYQYSGPDKENKTRLFSNIGRMPQLAPTARGTGQFDNSVYAAGLRVTYPLYVGGRIVADIEASRVLTLLTREQVVQTADELIFNLSNTFYNALRFQNDVKATEANVTALEEAQKNMRSHVEVGRAARVDLLKVNTRLAAVKQELTQVRNKVELAYVILKTLMGLDLTEPFSVKAKGALGHEAVTLDLAEDLREAESRRPALQASRRAVEAQEQRVQIAKGAHLPSIALRMQYVGGGGAESGGRSLQDFTAGMSISVPVFTGGQLTAHVAQEEAKLSKARADFNKSRLDVQREVQTAHLDISDSEERIATAQAALEDARETLRIEQLKTEVGRGIIENLLDAQAAELQAETNYTRALADYNTALVARRKAIGRIR